jgi:hypothetical protein
MAEPHRTPALDTIGRRLTAGLVAATLIAVAGGIALVAASFGIYAGLKTLVSPAAASGLTALMFAIIAGGLAVAAPAAIRGAPPAKPAAWPTAALPIDNAALRLGAEIAVTVFGLLAETALRRRVDKSARKRR